MPISFLLYPQVKFTTVFFYVVQKEYAGSRSLILCFVMTKTKNYFQIY